MIRQIASAPLNRRLGSALVTAMDAAGMSWADVAERLDCKPADVRRMVLRLLDGKPVWISAVSDIVWATGHGLELRLAPLQTPLSPAPDAADTQATIKET